MSERIRQLIEELGQTETNLDRTDCLLTWEQSDSDLKALLLATEIFEELYRANCDARLFRGGLAVSLFRDKDPILVRQCRQPAGLVPDGSGRDEDPGCPW